MRRTAKSKPRENTVASPPTTNQNGSPGTPDSKEAALREAWAARNLHIPTTLSRMIGDKALGTLGSKAYFNTILAEAGDPTDPVERMMMEQLTLAHHRIASLYSRADLAEGPEFARILHAAANRLLGEFRRLALAIRVYRQPASSRSFAVIGQQNVVANGSQQVEYVDNSSPAEARVSLKSVDRGKVEDSTRMEAANGHDGTEESPASGRWATQRLETAGVD